MLSYQIKICSLLAIALLSSCNLLRDESTFIVEKDIRTHLKDRLAAMPDVNYKKKFGYVPSDKEVELGRMLFNDPILSRNNDTSCATCHLSNHGFADGNTLTVGSLGVGGPNGDNVGYGFGEGVLSLNRAHGDDGMGFHSRKVMFRNSPSTLNVIHRADFKRNEGLFWDGRFGRLDFQVLLPIHTPEELCGTNPVPLESDEVNIFRKGGPLFQEPVTVFQSFPIDYRTGAVLRFGRAKPDRIDGIPRFRPNKQPSVPNRNECLAIMVAKVRSIDYYRENIQEIYKTKSITDRQIARALMAFVSTHVIKNTPYDRFVKGESSLTKSQLIGLGMFMTPVGQKIKLGDTEYMGVGCIDCHAPPEFGGRGYASLGVRSDPRSDLSKPVALKDLNETGFFSDVHGARGDNLRCHILGKTSTEDYAPDIGRAGGSFKTKDCFEFRIPPLRNIIETFPYFHHGSATGQGKKYSSLKERALNALEQVVELHLEGRKDTRLVRRAFANVDYFDKTFQRDPLIPYLRTEFTPRREDNKYFPLRVSDDEVSYIVDFIAMGLWDKDAVKIGELENDLSHPRFVPSGFRPSITRDDGTQLELPPKSNLIRE